MKPSRNLLLALTAFVMMAVLLQTAYATGGAASNSTSVLILGSTVSGSPSREETAVLANHPTWTVNVATNAEWAAMSASDFASYRAIIFGDPTCVANSSPLAAAESNTAWASAINGNVLIIGTDPVYHAGSNAGAAELIQKGIDFVLTNSAGRTAAYIDLSCYYHNASGASVPILDAAFGNGNFIVQGQLGGCPQNAFIVVTTHPALSGLTNADLSNWSCSIHNVFTTYTAPYFEVLAMTTDVGSSFTFTDGTGTHTGSPYILARGVSCPDLPTISVSLSPSCLWPPNHSMATITASITTTGTNTTVELVSVTSSQPDNGLGDGDTVDDIQGESIGTDDRSFQLRKERAGGSARTYTVTYRVTDECGFTAEASATVTVPASGGCN